MTPERWQHLKQIFQSALEHNPAERSAFLAQACAGDAALRKEVESLISSHNQAGDSIEAMAVEAATEILANDQDVPTIGQHIGHYQILSNLGRGGMGEVFLAEDMSLGRKVAVKLLRRDLTNNEERLRRFRQEARAASALNHPNILTIHEIGQDGPLHFIASEYVEGETLRQHISRGRISLAQMLDVAIQVASALAAAHQASIIHRDIKPENVMLRTDGYVKVLDFGLAKLAEPKTVTANAPTLPMVETQPGVIMGTVSYMSPEQTRGVTVDTRTDVWSLGVMLYEMATGRQPFDGETPSDVMSLILQKEPLPLAHCVPDVPAELERIVRKALRKDQEERYQTSKDLLIDLRTLRKELERESELERSGAPVATSPASGTQSTAAIAHTTSSAEYIVTGIKRHKWATALVLGLLIVTGAAAFYLFARRSAFSKTPPVNATFTQLTDQSGPEYFPSLSPDGKSVAYASYASGNWDIYLQRVGGKNPINLTKDSEAGDTQPAFSPDGERIAFRSERDGGGIFLMGATGESVKRLTDFGYNPAWSPDGKGIACADEGPVDWANRRNPNSRVWTVNVDNGEKRQLTKEDSTQPNWSPHAYRIAYQVRRNTSQRDILTISTSGGEPVPVTNDAAMDGSPIWSPDGNYLYFVSDRAGSMNLWRVLIDEQTGKVLGSPEAITTPSPYVSQLSLSHDGRRLAYVHAVRSGNIERVGFDPIKESVLGEPVGITRGTRLFFVPNLSPDGEWLVFDSQTDKQEDIYIVRRDGSGLHQLTDDGYKDRGARWSPDGKRIAFFSDRSGKWEIWMINADGSGLRQITYTTQATVSPIWSPDGTRIVYRNAGSTPSIIEVGKSWQEQKPQTLPPMSDPEGRVWMCSWSPDGRRLAGYQEHGNVPPAGIVVYSLDSQQYEKLTDFGVQPTWLSDNRRLIFLDHGKLYLIDSQSKKFHELISVAPHEFGYSVTLPRDDRLIYFSLLTVEADVWLMTLKE